MGYLASGFEMINVFSGDFNRVELQYKPDSSSISIISDCSEGDCHYNQAPENSLQEQHLRLHALIQLVSYLFLVEDLNIHIFAIV